MGQERGAVIGRAPTPSSAGRHIEGSGSTTHSDQSKCTRCRHARAPLSVCGAAGVVVLAAEEVPDYDSGAQALAAHRQHAPLSRA